MFENRMESPRNRRITITYNQTNLPRPLSQPNLNPTVSFSKNQSKLAVANPYANIVQVREDYFGGWPANLLIKQNSPRA